LEKPASVGKTYNFFKLLFMSSKYKFDDIEGVYFITSTVVDWIDVFTRDIYRDILLDSFRFCQKNQGLQLHAWVLMPNHFHLICSFKKANAGMVIKNIKSFTAMKIIDAILNNKYESRREWMLDIFEKNAQKMKSNFRFQLWQHENHPILLNNLEMYKQRMKYLHENPERSGFVRQAIDWKCSSAIDYYTENGKGLLDIIRFD
jgi:REP element-mobilizing transposase RayT